MKQLTRKETFLVEYEAVKAHLSSVESKEKEQGVPQL